MTLSYAHIATALGSRQLGFSRARGKFGWNWAILCGFGSLENVVSSDFFLLGRGNSRVFSYKLPALVQTRGVATPAAPSSFGSRTKLYAAALSVKHPADTRCTSVARLAETSR